MKAKLLSAWKWCKENVFKKDMILWVIIAELIFWSPVIVSFILGSFNSWWYGVGSAFILFWAGPFTPAVPLQIGLAVVLKKIYKKIKKRNKQNVSREELAMHKHFISHKYFISYETEDYTGGLVVQQKTELTEKDIEEIKGIILKDLDLPEDEIFLNINITKIKTEEL